MCTPTQEVYLVIWDSAEAHGSKTEWLEESGGEEAGLKSATVRIDGPDGSIKPEPLKAPTDHRHSPIAASPA